MKNPRYYLDEPEDDQLTIVRLLPKIIAIAIMVIALLVMLTRFNDAIASFEKKQKSALTQQEKNRVNAINNQIRP